MTYVITSPCVATCDTACVDACPVDCIIGAIPVEVVRAVPPAERAAKLPTARMFIDPDLCIDCGACLPRCPVSAIFADDDVPPEERRSLSEADAFFRARAGA